jgi:hypothetical protein
MIRPKRTRRGRSYRRRMTSTGIPVLAGIASTVIFAASVLPMVVKAWRTRDLRSYSRGNLMLANIGNGVHSVYVFNLPPGPIWALHGLYLVTSALMLAWSVRYASPRGSRVLRAALPYPGLHIGGEHPGPRPPLARASLCNSTANSISIRLTENAISCPTPRRAASTSS